MSSQIAMHTSVESFFRELLEDALTAERVQLEQPGAVYLLKVCSDFSRHQTLFARARAGESGTPTLTWLFADAQTTDPGQRFEALRHLGDVALVVSGFFGPHLERARSLVGVEYYVQMGSAAYSQAACLSRRSGFGEVLTELSRKFRRLVEVLTRVAERTTLPVAHDLGALCERMLRNPESPELQRRLLGQGLVPVWSQRGAA